MYSHPFSYFWGDIYLHNSTQEDDTSEKVGALDYSLKNVVARERRKKKGK